MELEKQLQQLQSIKATKGLINRIHGMASDLPTKHRGVYFPLVAFQAAVVMGVLLLLIGLGSGVVAAAKGSHPGSPFYPVKEMIEKIPGGKPSITQTITPSRVPSLAPKADVSPTLKVEKHDIPEEKTKKEEHKKENTSEKKEDVKGMTTIVTDETKLEKAQENVQNLFKKVFQGELQHGEKENSSGKKEND